MKAILIDSKNHSLQYVELESDTVACFAQAIEEEHILPVPCDEAELQNHFLIVDDVPYLKLEDTVSGCFTIRGFSKDQPYYNKGLIVGPPANGRYTECKLPLELIADRIEYETEHNAKEHHRIIREQDLVKWNIKL